MEHRMTRSNASLRFALIGLALTAGMGGLLAPTATAQTAASDQDKHFLEEISQDSNYEIKTSQLALQKSKSADVKQYATMVLHDHTQLNQQIRLADTAAKVTPVSSGGMSVADHAAVAELEVLSGDTFDKAYIKKLVKGNDEIQNDEKSEMANSSLPAVKRLAERSVALDTKHSGKAKELASAHNIQP